MPCNRAEHRDGEAGTWQAADIMWAFLCVHSCVHVVCVVVRLIIFTHEARARGFSVFCYTGEVWLEAKAIYL